MPLKLTMQEMFNDAWENWVVQKAPPSWANGTCVYRGLNGEKCAIGRHIPDEIYTPEMEKHSVQRLLYQFGGIDFPFRHLEMRFLRRFQICHDLSVVDGNKIVPHFHELIEESLRSLAKEFNLQIPLTFKEQVQKDLDDLTESMVQMYALRDAACSELIRRVFLSILAHMKERVFRLQYEYANGPFTRISSVDYIKYPVDNSAAV